MGVKPKSNLRSLRRIDEFHREVATELADWKKSGVRSDEVFAEHAVEWLVTMGTLHRVMGRAQMTIGPERFAQVAPELAAILEKRPDDFDHQLATLVELLQELFADHEKINALAAEGRLS